jgi:acetyl-CoA synthetase
MAAEANESKAIEAHLTEERVFPPDPAFTERAHANDPGVYERAAADPEAFWSEWARQLDWIEPWHTVCEWNPPHAKWFLGGKLNVSANCLDRHVKTARASKAAIIFEGEPGDTRVLTYHICGAR